MSTFTSITKLRNLGRQNVFLLVTLLVISNKVREISWTNMNTIRFSAKPFNSHIARINVILDMIQNAHYLQYAMVHCTHLYNHDTYLTKP